MPTRPLITAIALALSCAALPAAHPAAAVKRGARAGAPQDARRGKATVAVLEPSCSERVSPALRAVARGALSEYVAGEGYQAPDRAKLDRALSGHMVAGLPDEKTVKGLRTALGVELLLASDFYKEGQYYNITCWLIDTATGETAAANAFVEKDTPAEVLGVAEKLAAQLLGAKARAAGAAKGVVAAPSLGVEAGMAAGMAAGVAAGAAMDVGMDTAAGAAEATAAVAAKAAGNGAAMATAAAEAEAEEAAAATAEAPAAMEAEGAREAAGIAAKEAGDAKDAAEAARAAAIAAARQTVATLATHFDLAKGTAACANRELAQYADQQRQTVIAKKSDLAFALVAEIADGRLRGVSKYTYRGGANRLSHDSLSVTVGGRTASSPATPTRTIAPPTAAGVGSEEAELADAAPLRLIAANPSAQARIQVEDRDGFFKRFELSEAAQRAIARTVELFDALEILRKEGADWRGEGE